MIPPDRHEFDFLPCTYHQQTSPFSLLTSVIDGDISPADRAAVERLIQQEMPSHQPLHPMLPELPLPAMGLLVGGADEQYWRAQFESQGQGPVPSPDPAVDVSYAILAHRNAASAVAHGPQIASLHENHQRNVEQLVTSHEAELQRKRAHADELTGAREAKQTQFQPVAGYLEQRWAEGVVSLVDAAGRSP